MYLKAGDVIEILNDDPSYGMKKGEKALVLSTPHPDPKWVCIRVPRRSSEMGLPRTGIDGLGEKTRFALVPSPYTILISKFKEEWYESENL